MENMCFLNTKKIFLSSFFAKIKNLSIKGCEVKNMEPIIEVNNLIKYIDKKEVLKNVSFNVKKGEIIGLLGPNGSGKTTIIRILNGVIESSGGEVFVFGKNIKEYGKEIRKKCGIVTETTHLYHEMSAIDNLKFFASVYGVEDEERIEMLLKEFGMWEKRFETVGSFSTGMKKRVALCKALLPKPEILFLDEPTNGLDPEGIKFVFSYLKKLREKENVTIIICTHVLSQLDEFCDSYLFLKQGEVLEIGTKEEIEKKHIKEYHVKIKTTLTEESLLLQKYKVEKLENGAYLFYLKEKKEISTLLKELLKEAIVEEVRIENNNLDTLYFLVGGEYIYE